MLFKLSLKNIKKSAKDYAIYFFTLILGVAIFYVFNALETQAVMLNVSKSTAEIIGLMNTMLSGVSIFVSIILGTLIIYANRFLIKRRNKEFGIYLTLGMSKRKMSLILFFETLFIGILSLGVGIGLGVVLSQFMSIIVANMFEADMTKFTFVFSKSAFIKTLIYFGIMYLIVILFSTIQINKCKLIDLLYGSKKSEKLKLKNPLFCTIVFIVSCIFLGIQYYKVYHGFTYMKDEKDLLLIIAIGSVSTFFIFWSLSGLLIKIFTSMKKIYYKGLNSFTLRQFSSKVNTMVFSMSIISLMLFITICLLSSAFTLTKSMNSNIKDMAPVDYEIEYQEFSDSEHEHPISSDIEKYYDKYNVKSYFTNYISFRTYSDENFTFKSFLGNTFDETSSKYGTLDYDSSEQIMKLSDYNKLMDLYGNEKLSLNNDEYILLCDFKSMKTIRDNAIKNNNTINVFGKTLKSKYNKTIDGFISISAQHTNTGVFVVDDSVVDEYRGTVSYFIGNYKAKDKEEKENVENIINNINEKITEELKANNIYYYNLPVTKISLMEASIGLSAMVTFIGMYLGIIFLISSAVILALKELSESTDNKDKFAILRKIGTDEKLINKTLFIQIGIFFLFPLLIACIHSFFGIKFASIVLETFGNEAMFSSILITASIIFLIYGGYFLITYYNSKNIIKERIGQ